MSTTMNTTIIRTYSKLITLPTFEERYRYLRLSGVIGNETFGSNRYLNQAFYKSGEWFSIRDKVIVRDNGCDLAMPDRAIYGRVLIHHLNPITLDDIENRSDFLLDPEYLICVTKRTHDAIHYGDEGLLILPPPERTPYDTCPWKRR